MFTSNDQTYTIYMNSICSGSLSIMQHCMGHSLILQLPCLCLELDQTFKLTRIWHLPLQACNYGWFGWFVWTPPSVQSPGLFFCSVGILSYYF